MRRPASSTRPGRSAPGGPFACLLLGLALAPDSASAQYMALTAPAKPTPVKPVPAEPEAPRPVPDARKPVTPPARAAQHAFDGSLPNQRTGPSRQRTVRDICIGCDR